MLSFQKSLLMSISMFFIGIKNDNINLAHLVVFPVLYYTKRTKVWNDGPRQHDCLSIIFETIVIAWIN